MGHWQVVGRKQEAARAFARTRITSGSLEHHFLWNRDRAYCTSSPDLQNFGECGGGAYCITPSSKSGKGQKLMASVSWLNKCWHTGFSLPEWEQSWRGRGNRRWYRPEIRSHGPPGAG